MLLQHCRNQPCHDTFIAFVKLAGGRSDKADHAAFFVRKSSAIADIKRIDRQLRFSFINFNELEQCVDNIFRERSEIGISVRDTVDAFLGSRDVRNKYQSSTLLWDLGLTEEFAGYLEKVAESE